MKASATAVRAGEALATADAIVRPGINCWRTARADRFTCVHDAADYFRLVREALLAARHSVFILGWDILASVDLLPGEKTDGAPTRLDELLAFVVRRHPRLRSYILIWDYAALYTLERDPLSRWRLGWKTPRRVRFGFDDRHPVGGSHHQKIVVVDDELAFSGGIDLTGHRWDTSAHRVEEPARTSAGEPYGPYHDVQAMVSGPIARSLGQLARDRWRALGEKRMPPPAAASADLWPSAVAPDFTDVEVAISRTVPGTESQAAIRECEALYVDSIAQARQSIYIESQYFTNDTLGDALADRLGESDGPEVIVVTPAECHGWLERNTMGAFRDKVCRQLIAADTHGRLRLVYPAASRAQQTPTFVHSKVMVVDDRLVRIGSANFSRRSMGVDSECDLAVDAGSDRRVRSGIRRIRDRMLGEHLGLTGDAVALGLEREGTLCALIDWRANADRTLARIELPAEPLEQPSAALLAIADPDEPILASSVAQLVPPVGASNRLRPLSVPIFSALVVTAAVAVASFVLIDRPEFQAIQSSLDALPGMPWSLMAAAAAFLLGNLVLIPFELMAIVAGVLFGALLGGVAALLGSMAAAAVGYAAGRAIGPTGITRWMSRRAYRSGRQLGARGVIGVIVLRLSSVASAGSIHLLCGAGRVPFSTYMAGTAAGLAPAALALGALGASIRQMLLHPSLSTAAAAIGAAVVLVAAAVALRTFLLIRRFAPSVSSHRAQAEFG